MAKSVEVSGGDRAKKSLDDHGVAHSPKNAAINTNNYLVVVV